jgi:hypothetical protein
MNLAASQKLFHICYLYKTIYNYASIAAGRHGRDHIVVGFISTYAISVYHR